MANESTIFSVTKINPVVGQGDVTKATNGTMTTPLCKVEYVVASFTKAEGKERLLNALRAIIAEIEQSDYTGG